MSQSRLRRLSLCLLACLAIATSSLAFAISPDVEAAGAILSETHPEQCQKQQLKVQLLLAHQAHNEEKLQELGAQLDALNKRLKAKEDQLSALTAKINKNSDDKADFEELKLKLGNCE